MQLAAALCFVYALTQTSNNLQSGKKNVQQRFNEGIGVFNNRKKREEGKKCSSLHCTVRRGRCSRSRHDIFPFFSSVRDLYEKKI